MKVELGKKIFNDHSLSEPYGQACADCHAERNAFANAGNLAITAGANTKFGNRNSPSVVYALFIPEFHYDKKNQRWLGGQFWDGRADTLSDQAKQPILNPLEMNNTPAGFAEKLRASNYSDAFAAVYGEDIWGDSSRVLTAASEALAAFQSSESFTRFSSKFDAWQRGETALSNHEMTGYRLFTGKAQCASCHLSSADEGPPLFSDYAYYNLGVPKNMQSPFLHVDKQVNPLGIDYQDEGLALNPNLPPEQRPTARGKFRTPSLRNVALTAPYMHNGVFKDLREAVSFIASRDSDNADWPAAEVAENVETQTTGNLGLSPSEIDALVAFLRTLSDGYDANTARLNKP